MINANKKKEIKPGVRRNAERRTEKRREIKKDEADTLTFEIRRKIFHILLGSILIFLIYKSIIDAEIIFFILIFGIILSLICRKYNVLVISKALEFFDRKEHTNQFPERGVIFFFIGVLLVIKLFPEIGR